MDSNFDIDPFDLEVMKSHFKDADHLNICVRCKVFDYRGKTKQQTIAHFEACMAGAGAAGETPNQYDLALASSLDIVVDDTMSIQDNQTVKNEQMHEMVDIGTQTPSGCGRPCALRIKYLEQALAKMTQEKKDLERAFNSATMRLDVYEKYS